MRRFGKLVKRITFLRLRGGLRKRRLVPVLRMRRGRRGAKMRIARLLIRRIRRR